MFVGDRTTASTWLAGAAAVMPTVRNKNVFVRATGEVRKSSVVGPTREKRL